MSKTQALLGNLARWVEPLRERLQPRRALFDLVPPQPDQPSERALMMASLAALFVPRAAGTLLMAPYLAAERETLRRQQAWQQALDRQLRLAQLETERRKAETPIIVEQIREAGRAAERDLQTPKVQAEVRKLEAETEATRQRTQQAAQRLPVEIAGRIAGLLERAGDERVGEEERRMMIGYAKYLMNEYGVDLKDFLPAETQASPAQARTAAQALQEASEAQRAAASAELLQEQAQTERELRPLRKEQAQARIQLIRAQELTERMQPELLRARIREIQANIAQGWRGLALRAQSLNLAIQRQDFAQQRQLLEQLSKSRAFWERQASELEKALRVEVEQQVQGAGETALITTRTRRLDPAQERELRDRLAEVRRLADNYRQLEQSLQNRLLNKPAPAKPKRQIRLRDGTVVEVEGGGN